MQQSPTSVGQVKAKWKTLTRAYRASRDRGTGTSGTKFPYIKEMDELFLNKPSTSCPHVVSVGVERLLHKCPHQHIMKIQMKSS